MIRNKKNYKNLFAAIKKQAKKMHYSNKLTNCTGDVNKHGML